MDLRSERFVYKAFQRYISKYI